MPTVRVSDETLEELKARRRRLQVELDRDLTLEEVVGILLEKTE